MANPGCRTRNPAHSDHEARKRKRGDASDLVNIPLPTHLLLEALWPTSAQGPQKIVVQSLPLYPRRSSRAASDRYPRFERPAKEVLNGYFNVFKANRRHCDCSTRDSEV